MVVAGGGRYFSEFPCWAQLHASHPNKHTEMPGKCCLAMDPRRESHVSQGALCHSCTTLVQKVLCGHMLRTSEESFADSHKKQGLPLVGASSSQGIPYFPLLPTWQLETGLQLTWLPCTFGA